MWETYHASTTRQQANILQNPRLTSKHVLSYHQSEILIQCMNIANAWLILYLPLSSKALMASMYEHVNEWH